MINPILVALAKIIELQVWTLSIVASIAIQPNTEQRKRVEDLSDEALALAVALLNETKEEGNGTTEER